MLDFVFWDVQHGSACYINTPNNRHIVVDLGTGSYVGKRPFSPLLHLKHRYGIEQLDYVIITHPHRDHIDDISNFTQLAPKTLRCPSYLTAQEVQAGNKKEDVAKVAEYLAIVGRYSVLVQPGSPFDGEASSHWGGVQMTFFRTPLCGTSNLNNHSIVTVLEYANSRIMIPGDNESESWKTLIKDERFIKAARNLDVMIAPHHGRESAYFPGLFDAIGKPCITIISDGPEGDTSATDSYRSQSRGWRVYYPDHTFEERFCVTTRQDGVIRVRAYYASDGSARLNVHVQNGSAKSSGRASAG